MDAVAVAVAVSVAVAVAAIRPRRGCGFLLMSDASAAALRERVHFI